MANSQLAKRVTIRKTFMPHYTSTFILLGYNIAPEFTELYHIKKQTCHFFLSSIKYRNLCPPPGGCCQLPSFGTWRNGCSIHVKVEQQWPEDFLFKYTSYTTCSPLISGLRIFLVLLRYTLLPSCLILACLTSGVTLKKKEIQVNTQHLLVTNEEKKLPEIQVLKF